MIDHPFSQALLNMYDYLFEELENNFTMTPLEFWSHTRAVETMSILFAKNSSYRGTYYLNGGILTAPLLDNDQIGVLQQMTNRINYKILYEINKKAVNPEEYKFSGTFSIFDPYLQSTAFSGNYDDFVNQAKKAKVDLPTQQQCPC